MDDKTFRNADHIRVTRSGGYVVDMHQTFNSERVRRQFHLIEKYRKEGKLK